MSGLTFKLTGLVRFGPHVGLPEGDRTWGRFSEGQRYTRVRVFVDDTGRSVDVTLSEKLLGATRFERALEITPGMRIKISGKIVVWNTDPHYLTATTFKEIA